MLKLVGIGKSYESGGQTDNFVLKDITLEVKEGVSISIVGPSGCGKSTLLNIIGGLDYPSYGQVLFDGKEISKLDEEQLSKIRNKEIGFVFQLHHLLPQCTVLENVLIPTLAYKSKETRLDIEQRAEELLKRVGLDEHKNFTPGQLSGGQRQRVAVVRALINKPKLLLADEPTGSLDRKSADNIFELLIELNKSEGVTLIAVTHSVRLAEKLERVLELNDGVLKDWKG